MFFAGSRYAQTGTYTVRLADGREVQLARLPLPPHNPTLRGYYPRKNLQRLDHIAAHYLDDATAFWRLCDASDTISPDALAMRDLIPVPTAES